MLALTQKTNYRPPKGSTLPGFACFRDVNDWLEVPCVKAITRYVTVLHGTLLI